MPYIICDGRNYYCQNEGGSLTVRDVNEATKWKKASSARGVCDGINRSKKFKGYKFDVMFIPEKNNSSYTPEDPVNLDYQILDKIKEISKFASQIEERRCYLNFVLKKIELNIIDIEHAAEFYELSASQGYKIYKLLHEARIERRKVKDELEIINLLSDTAINSISLNNLKGKVVGLDNRKYRPRINKELFGV